MSQKMSVSGFDFHCHIDLFPDPAAAIAVCEAAGIFTLAVTTTPKAWEQNRRWTEGRAYVHAAPGLHPELAASRRAETALLEGLMAESPFVGEVGLDASPPHRHTLSAQREVFTRALKAAERLGGRVVSIHSRRAAQEVLDCLEQHTTPARVLPIMHWFSDAPATAKLAAERGCYFSVNHRMLASESGLTLVRALPADRLLTETDAPFTEFDGRKSEPRDVMATATALAGVRGMPAAQMADSLRANAARVLAFAGLENTFGA
jgi:TatD DNase family protein